ncbi:MAG: FAD-dependent oxidoreductase [Candidatus Auribacterota bacterium]|nr:FAD-dependent oxidoreductase [Candidatus Auribacterota bacterium]
MKIAVLGAGISGLWASRELYKKGYDFRIFESLPQIGGLCRTETMPNGFVFDVGGCHIFHSVYKDILTDMLECVGLENLNKIVRKTRIYDHGTFIKYPFENGLSDLPDNIKYECLMGYIYAWHEYGGKPQEYENFSDFIYKRFGNGIAEHFMNPYNRKIWCVEPDQMDVDWIQNRVPQAPIEDVVKAALGIQTEGYKHQAVFYYPKEGGAQTFINAVAQPFMDKIYLNSEVASIERHKSGWLVNGQPFDYVISSIPLDRFCNICDAVSKAGKERASKLRHISVVALLLCLKKDLLPDYSWIYLPQPHQSEANRLTYFSNYSSNLCPDNQACILCEATYIDTKPQDITEQRMRSMIVDLERSGLVNQDDIHTFYWSFNEYAYVLPDLNMTRNRDAVTDELSTLENLSIIGRFGSFRYYNIDQVIKQAKDLIKDKF